MTIVKTLAAATLALGMVSAPALAQPQQEGLIIVNVTDVGVSVQVPIAIAANVCGVAVNVLAEQLLGDVDCDAEAEAVADNQQFMRFAEQQDQADAILAATN
jgi:hypothetical protein